MARRPMILPVILIPAICIIANVFLYPQVREEVSRYVQAVRRPHASLNPTDAVGRDEPVVSAVASESVPPTDLARGNHRRSDPEQARPLPATQAGLPPQTGASPEGRAVATASDARLEDSADSAEPNGKAVPPPASLRADSRHLDTAREVLAAPGQTFRDDFPSKAGSSPKASRDTAAEIANIPAEADGEGNPDDCARPGNGGSGPGDSLKQSAIANPADSSSTSGSAKAPPAGEDREKGAAAPGESAIGDPDASTDASDDAPPLEPILWPRGKSDGSRINPLAAAEPSAPPSPPHDSRGVGSPESRRVRRLPPPGATAGETHDRLRSAAEAVEPIPLYPDTGYPAFFP